MTKLPRSPKVKIQFNKQKELAKFILEELKKVALTKPNYISVDMVVSWNGEIKIRFMDICPDYTDTYTSAKPECFDEIPIDFYLLNLDRDSIARIKNEEGNDLQGIEECLKLICCKYNIKDDAPGEPFETFSQRVMRIKNEKNNKED